MVSSGWSQVDGGFMFARLFSLIMLFSILASGAFAQSQDSTPAQNGTTPATQGANSNNPPKKVWTNEDLPTGKNGVSVVGDKRNKAYHSGSQTGDPVTAARMKNDLAKLQKQLDDVNSKLKTYKEFQDGEAVSKGERDMSQAYSRTPVDQQMQHLLDKKKQLETQIGDLLDDARKKGIDPGDLR
jgi:predicted lipoprotein